MSPGRNGRTTGSKGWGVPARLGVFAGTVVLSFTVAFGVGAAIGPDLDVDPAHDMTDQGAEAMDHDGS